MIVRGAPIGPSDSCDEGSSSECGKGFGLGYSGMVVLYSRYDVIGVV